MDHIVRRRSKLAPPPSGVFAALVRHLPRWWISIDGEQEPALIDSMEGSQVIWSSPFQWRPIDRVEIRLAPGQYGGCVLELDQTSGEPLQPREASTLRHRWGEHLDRDLRDFLDDGSTKPYRFSTYRADVEDWSILESVADRRWVVASPVWARTDVQIAPGRSWMPVRPEAGGEHLLSPGVVLWSFVSCRHQAAVRCLAERPDDLEDVVVPDWLRHLERYRGFELVLPVAVFGRELKLVETG